LLFLLVGGANAEDSVSQMTWDLAVGETIVGTRTLTIKEYNNTNPRRRMLQGWTEIDAAHMGTRFTYKQRLTAHASGGPASFQAVIEQSGQPREIQGRRMGGGWQVNITEGTKTRSWSLDSSQVDLSTVDLADPQSSVPISRLNSARLLSAETGLILEGDIMPMGASTLNVDGKSVAVQGYRLSSDEAKATFYYTPEGVLVRYETYLVGLSISGTLRNAPPPGVDDFSVLFLRPRILESDL